MTVDGDELCPHDGDPHTCPPCQRAAGRLPAVEELRRLRTFTARYDGQCPECTTPIWSGQEVSRWSDGQTRHEVCQPW